MPLDPKSVGSAAATAGSVHIAPRARKGLRFGVWGALLIKAVPLDPKSVGSAAAGSVHKALRARKGLRFGVWGALLRVYRLVFRVLGLRRVD